MNYSKMNYSKMNYYAELIESFKGNNKNYLKEISDEIDNFSAALAAFTHDKFGVKIFFIKDSTNYIEKGNNNFAYSLFIRSGLKRIVLYFHFSEEGYPITTTFDNKNISIRSISELKDFFKHLIHSSSFMKAILEFVDRIKLEREHNKKESIDWADLRGLEN